MYVSESKTAAEFRQEMVAEANRRIALLESTMSATTKVQKHAQYECARDELRSLKNFFAAVEFQP